MEGKTMSAGLRNYLKLTLAALGLVGTLVMVEAIVTNHNYRVDLTPEKRFTLSDHARKVVSGLARDVHVTAMLRSDRPDNLFIEDILWRMASLSSHFSYDVVDMNRSPAVARQYGVSDYGTFVVQSNGRRRDALFSAGEADLVFAILQVGRSQPKVVYFLSGHGEKNLRDEHPDSGFTRLKSAIIDDFYEVRDISLAETGQVPEDAGVVVICGPQTNLLANELVALDAYVRRGGSLLVLLDPEGSPSLVAFLQQYGVNMPSLIVADPQNRIFAGEDLTFKASATSFLHPILKGVTFPPVFSLVRVVEVQGDEAKGIIGRPVLASSGEGWATPDTSVLRRGQATFEPGRDIPGPVPVGGEVLVPAAQGREGRIVVYGDADFTNNFLIQHLGNKDLVVNTVNWLAEDPGQMSTRPQSQEVGRHQFFMSSGQGTTALVLSTLVMPGMLLAVGVGLFLWRKR
jgi:ABC-type uncharacterized transport system involved in gliding motility auxiliary subunit